MGLDGMYRYRCPCSLDTMPQLINLSDWRMMTSQSLGSHGPDHFIWVRDLVNVQTRTTAEHFPYQEKSVQYRQHAVVHYPAET
ncbi:hypothetical protein TNCV_5038651 [Trichonephila clavipes]|nr:hypothetical protein TNCV_5038651 [Trichonephila clavipes]